MPEPQPPVLAKALALVLMLASAALAWGAAQPDLLYLSLFSSMPLIVATVIRSTSLELLSAKLPLALLTLLAGFYYPAYLLFVVALVIACRIYFQKMFGIIYPKLV